jgi:hypothetical protein
VFRQPASQLAGSHTLPLCRRVFESNRQAERHQPKTAVFKKRRIDMDSPTIIRVVAGLLFVIVLGILVQRRRTKVR